MRRVRTQGRSGRKRTARATRAKNRGGDSRSTRTRTVAKAKQRETQHITVSDDPIRTADEMWLAHVAGAIRLRGGRTFDREAA